MLHMFFRYVGIHKFLKLKFWFNNSLSECTTWQGKIKKKCVSVDFPPLNWDVNGWFTNCPPIQHMFFRHNFTEISGRFTAILLRSPPCGAITNSEVTASNSLFLCWLAHLVGFNSGPNILYIFRRYEQVWFTAILGDYFRIFFGVSSRTGFEPSPTKTPWRSEGADGWGAVVPQEDNLQRKRVDERIPLTMLVQKWSRHIEILPRNWIIRVFNL